MVSRTGAIGFRHCVFPDIIIHFIHNVFKLHFWCSVVLQIERHNMILIPQCSLGVIVIITWTCSPFRDYYTSVQHNRIHFMVKETTQSNCDYALTVLR